MRRMFPDDVFQKQVEDLQALLGGYTSDDASTKKIYYHPISIIKRTTGINYNLSFIILNNDATPFTIDTFKDFIDNLYTKIGNVVRFNCAGYWQNADKSKHGSTSVLAKTSSNNYDIVFGSYDNDSSYVTASWDNIIGSPQEFTDGVNDIN